MNANLDASDSELSTDRRRSDPPDLHPPAGNRYSHVIRAGSLVFVAGQVPVDVNGKVVGDGDPKAQAEQVLKNLDIALKSVGATRGDIVRITTYATDAAHLEGIGAAREGWFGDAPPTSTLLIVRALANPAYLVEIDAIAVVTA